MPGLASLTEQSFEEAANDPVVAVTVSGFRHPRELSLLVAILKADIAMARHDLRFNGKIESLSGVFIATPSGRPFWIRETYFDIYLTQAGEERQNADDVRASLAAQVDLNPADFSKGDWSDVLRSGTASAMIWLEAVSGWKLRSINRVLEVLEDRFHTDLNAEFLKFYATLSETRWLPNGFDANIGINID